MMRIAVDAGILATPRSGIGRYLHELLTRMVGAGGERQWLLYGRGGPSRAGVRCRNDGLPADLGRVLALGTSLPAWLMLDRPDLFWGPAHRLPLLLPRGTARVVTVHDLCWLKQPSTMRTSTRWLDRTLMPFALRAADRIIAVSRATGDDLVSAFPETRSRVAVVHEAASPMTGPRDAASLVAWRIDGPYVLFVGTLEPRKNLLRLLRAFAQSSVTARLLLVIAGAPGWGGEHVQREASALGIGERVRILGRVDDSMLSTLYRHAECLAMPSLYEGFGLPLLEAMSQGTPVLYGDNSSMPEVAGDAGLGVDAESVDSIASGLSRVLADPVLRRELSARARAQAAKFSWDRAARETLSVFDDAVAVRGARQG